MSACFVSFGQSSRSQFNFELVKKQMLESGNYMMDEAYIEGADSSRFDMIELNGLRVVHLPYKTSATNSSDRFSQVLIYQLNDTSLILLNCFPYYYKLRLLDKESALFVSDNLLCNSEGSCTHHFELAKLSDAKLETVTTFDGFDNEAHFEMLWMSDRLNELETSIGDTICKRMSISQYDQNTKSITLIEKINVLTGVDADSLIIDHKENVKSIKLSL